MDYQAISLTISQENPCILPLHFVLSGFHRITHGRKPTKEKRKQKAPLFQVSHSRLYYSLHQQTTINPSSLYYPLFQVSTPRRAQLSREPGCAAINWPKILSFWSVSRCWNPRRKDINIFHFISSKPCLPWVFAHFLFFPSGIFLTYLGLLLSMPNFLFKNNSNLYAIVIFADCQQQWWGISGYSLANTISWQCTKEVTQTTVIPKFCLSIFM